MVVHAVWGSHINDAFDAAKLKQLDLHAASRGQHHMYLAVNKIREYGSRLYCCNVPLLSHKVFKRLAVHVSFSDFCLSIHELSRQLVTGSMRFL